jgi:hypothetical protein
MPGLLAERDARGCYPPRNGVSAARTLQLTQSEVELVKAQKPQLRAAMRVLKAWRSFGGHGVGLGGPGRSGDAGGLSGAACEVIVMAAAGRARLVDPLLDGGNSAATAAPVGRPLDAFAAALRLMRDRLRPGNPSPIYAPVWYGGEGPVWEPAEPPYTPIILNPAGGRAAAAGESEVGQPPGGRAPRLAGVAAARQSEAGCRLVASLTGRALAPRLTACHAAYSAAWPACTARRPCHKTTKHTPSAPQPQPTTNEPQTPRQTTPPT